MVFGFRILALCEVVGQTAQQADQPDAGRIDPGRGLAYCKRRTRPATNRARNRSPLRHRAARLR